MDVLDRPTQFPAEDTLVQSQAILFAAALFIGCTIFDAQVVTQPLERFAKILPERAAAGTGATARPAPAPAQAAMPAAAAAVPAAKPMPGVAKAPAAPRQKPVVYKSARASVPARLPAWQEPSGEVLFATSVLPRID